MASPSNIFEAAEKGDIASVKYFIDQKKVGVNSKNSSGGTALMKASESGNLEVIKFLLEKGANINQSDKWGYTALLWAVDKHLADFSTIKYLVDHKARTTVKDNYKGYSPLHWAAQHGDLQIVKYLVEKGAPIDDKSIDGETPVQIAAAHNRFPVLEYFLTERKAKFDIFEAAEKGYTNAVQYFIERKKKPATAVDADGWSVLHRAAYGGALHTVQFLVQTKGVNVNVSNARRKTPVTPLHGSAERGHLDVATYLVEKGADPNARDFQGRTPLYWACHNGHQDLVAYFVDTVGSDPEDRDSYDRTLLHAACYKGNPTVARYLVEQKRLDTNVQDNEGRTALMECIQTGNKDVLQYLMEQTVSPANVKLVDKSGNNAVHYAATKGSTNTIKELVKMGFDDKLKNHKGQTPLDVAKEVGPKETTVSPGDEVDLKKADEQCSAYSKAPENANKKCMHVAAAKGNLALVKTLVRRGENINEIDGGGQTALYYAVEGGNLSVVRFLATEKGADVHVKYQNQNTLLHVAAESKQPAASEIPVIKYLIEERGMNVNEQDNSMETPVYKAAKAANFDIFKFLIEEMRADFRIRDPRETTCLMWISRYGDLNTVKWLLAKGDDVNARETGGRSALSFAVEYYHLDLVRYLVDEKKMNVNEHDNNNHNLVHWTTVQNKSTYPALIKYLVHEKHLNVNEQNKYGITPLMYAATRAYMNLFKFFVEEASADFRIRDPNETTCLMWIARHGDLDMVKWLLAKGDDVDAKNKEGRNALSYAVEFYQLDLVRYLVDEKGVDVNGRDISNHNLVHWTTVQNKSTYPALIKYLVNEKNLNVNEQNNAGWTPLMYAASRAYMNLFKFFIEEMSADFRIRTSHKVTCLMVMARHGDLDMVKWLLAKGDDVNAKEKGGRSALSFAVEYYHLDLVRYLVDEKKLDINERDDVNHNLVHWTTVQNLPTYPALIKYLVNEKNLNVNEQNKFGTTPLMYAATRAYMNLFKFFVEETSADFRIRDPNETTCLMWISRHGDLDMVKWLLAKGDDVNAKNKEGRNALSYAVEYYHLDLVRYLVDEKKVDVTVRDTSNNNLVHWTTVQNKPSYSPLIKYLVKEKYLNVNEKNNFGQTPLMLAAIRGYMNLTQFLIEEMSADFRIRDPNKGTILHWMAIHGNLNMLKLLVSKGDDINAKNAADRGALWFAAENNRMDVLRYLVEEKKLDARAKDNIGYTLLHIASDRNHVDIVKYLVEKVKLDLNVKDNNGKTALALAVEGEGQRGKMIEYLKSKGARLSRRRRDAPTFVDTSNETPTATNAAYKHYSAINCAVHYVQQVVASTRFLSTATGSSGDTNAARESNIFGFTNGFLLLANVIRAKFFGDDRTYLFTSPTSTMRPSPLQLVQERVDPNAETAIFDMADFFES